MESVTLKCVDHWFKNLLRDLTFTGSFCDVTLVLDDHSQMKSHRVVLAASSYFFKNILLNNEDQENYQRDFFAMLEDVIELSSEYPSVLIDPEFHPVHCN